LNGNDFQIESLGDFNQIGQSSHFAIIFEYFDQNPCRLESCEPGEIDSCFGVTSTAEYAAVFRNQRKDMAGAAKLFRFDIGIDKCLDGFRTVRRGNSSCTAITLQVDRYREIRFINSRVVAHHEVQVECFASLLGKRHTHQATAVVGHEIDNLWRCITCSCDEIPLVLTVFIIHHDNYFAKLDIFDGLLNGM